MDNAVETSHVGLPVPNLRTAAHPKKRSFFVPIIVMCIAGTIPAIYEYLSLRGWVNVDAARVVLFYAWVFAVGGLVWGARAWPDATSKRRIFMVASPALILACLFVALDQYV